MNGLFLRFFLLIVLVFSVFRLRFGLAPLGLHTTANRHGQEAAVLVEQFHQLVFVDELLQVVVFHVQHDFGAAVGFFNLFEGEVGGAVTAPLNCLSVFLIRFGEDIHTVGDHEGGVETESEMTDDVSGVVAFVFGEEVLRAGEGDLVDIAIDLLGGHTDTAVDYMDGFVVFVDLHVDGEIAEFAVGLAQTDKRFEFLCGIYCVGNQFSKENLVVRIQEFLDHGKDIFCLYINFTCLHIFEFLTAGNIAKSVPFLAVSLSPVERCYS